MLSVLERCMIPVICWITKQIEDKLIAKTYHQFAFDLLEATYRLLANDGPLFNSLKEDPSKYI